MYKIMAVLLLVGICVGCAAMHVETYYPVGKFQAKSPQEVQIFYSDPARPYQIIGACQGAVVQGLFKDDAPQLKAQAAAIGADGVVLLTKQGNCHEVLVSPEHNKAQEETDKNANHEKTKVEEVNKPAEYSTECDRIEECKIIRFND